ncbi:MAG: hypothetical protein H0W36_12970 [Gemmatimonadetes bacterium]|nr:hypothetical protein [Gemmatimonadota bacterium]
MGHRGIAVLLVIAFLLSTDRRAISLRKMIGTLAIQVAKPGIRAVIAARFPNLISDAIAGMLV